MPTVVPAATIGPICPLFSEISSRIPPRYEKPESALAFGKKRELFTIQGWEKLSSFEDRSSIEDNRRIDTRASNRDDVFCEVGDETFRTYIPESHTAQVLHQMMILDVNVAIF